MCGGTDAPPPTVDQVAAVCPSEYSACEAAPGCEDALRLALSGGDPDPSGPGIAELEVGDMPERSAGGGPDFVGMRTIMRMMGLRRSSVLCDGD